MTNDLTFWMTIGRMALVFAWAATAGALLWRWLA